MRRFLAIANALLPLALAAPAVRADEPHQHAHGPADERKLGKVDFPVSCSPAARAKFTRAVALLHSFWYAEAEKAFGEVAASDPECAMAHWGVAMSVFQQIWAPPTPEEFQRGLAAVEKLRAAPPKTDRERDWAAAITTYFTDADRLNHGARKLAYEKAMERLAARHPQDREASIFYALALIGTAPPNDKTYLNQKKAAAILNRILPEQPEHPGIAHYVIHSFDYPALAELALPAARAYSKIAPDSPHALHMPSHIFTRLSLWKDSIASNLASAEAAKRHVARTHPGAASFDQVHALDYLEYAYLQRGQDQKAAEVLREIGAVEKLDLPNFAAAYGLAAVPARNALERRRWSEAASLSVRPTDFPWDRYPYAEAITHFAKAIGAARSGDSTRAREAVAKLETLQKALVGKDAYWAGQVEIQQRAAAAWLALQEGKKDKALELARSAADLEDSTDKHPVTPGAILPARELLAEMLLELDQPKQALAEYEASLATAPGRFQGLLGAARAAGRAGEAGKARRYYENVATLCEESEGTRPELAEVKSKLALVN